MHAVNGSAAERVKSAAAQSMSAYCDHCSTSNEPNCILSFHHLAITLCLAIVLC